MIKYRRIFTRTLQAIASLALIAALGGEIPFIPILNTKSVTDFFKTFFIPETPPNVKKISFLCGSSISAIELQVQGILDFLSARNINYTTRVFYHNRDMTLLKNQIEECISWRPDVCVALGVLSAQTANTYFKRKTQGQIPLLFGAIADPQSHGIETKRGLDGDNCTGLAQDIQDLAEESNNAFIRSMRTVRPGVKTTLIFYDTTSSMMYSQAQSLEQALEANGIKTTLLPASTPHDVRHLAHAYITSDIDVVIVLRDYMVIQSLQFLRKLCVASGATLFASDSHSVSAGAAAGCCIDEYEQGILLGEYAYKILTSPQEEQARTLPVTLFKIADLHKTFVNHKEMNRQGITLSLYDILKSPERVILAVPESIKNGARRSSR